MIGIMDPAMTLVVLALDRKLPLVLAVDVQIVTATPTRLKTQGMARRVDSCSAPRSGALLQLAIAASAVALLRS